MKNTTLLVRSLMTALFSLSLMNNAFAANVKNMSSDEFAQYGKEDAYWIVSVDCDDGSTGRVIQRKTDSDTWCARDAKELCSDDKATAANKVCSDEYNSASSIVAANKKKQADAEKAKAQAKAKEKAEAERRQQAQERQRLARAAEVKAAKSLQDKISLEQKIIALEQESVGLLERELELNRRLANIDKLLEQAN